MSYFDDVKKTANLLLPWEKLSGKNILITGATGMIGSSLIDVLMSRESLDFHIYASGRNEAKVNAVFSKYIKNSYFHFVHYDVREPLESDVQFQYIIAGAGVASPQLYTTDPVSVIKSNLWGVDNLLSYGVKNGLEKFLYISSGEVYGEGDGHVFSEDYSGYVNCATLRASYPSAKRAAESLCIAYSHQYGIDVSIARPCHIYGPYFNDSDKRVYAQFIRNILNDENIEMKSLGTQNRSWCYVVDCVSALLCILLNGKNGEAYNIADENSNITIKALAEMIAKIGGKNVVFRLPDEIEKQGFSVVKKAVFSTEKIRTLGWSCCGTMEDKLMSTIEVLRNGNAEHRRNPLTALSNESNGRANQ